MQSGGMLVVWFVLIVALIPVSLYFLKKSGLAQGALGTGDKVLRPISQLAVGPGQRVVTVEFGTGEQKTWLVLGVTPNSINTLYTLQPSDDSQNQAKGDPVSSTFPVLLRRSTDIIEPPKG